MTEVKQSKELKGIKGWLLIAVISFILRIVLIFLSSISISIFINANEVIDAAYKSYINTVVYGNYAFVLIGIIILIFTFKKDKRAPRAIIFFYLWYMIFLIAVGSIFAKSLEVDMFEYTSQVVEKSIGYVIVWGLYFNKSVRVKNTFVDGVVETEELSI